MIDPKNSHRAETSLRVAANLIASHSSAVPKHGCDHGVNCIRSGPQTSERGWPAARAAAYATAWRPVRRPSGSITGSIGKPALPVVVAIHPRDRHEMRDLPEKHDEKSARPPMLTPPCDSRPADERWQRAGHGADERGDRRPPFHRRVNDQVDRQRRECQQRREPVRSARAATRPAAESAGRRCGASTARSRPSGSGRIRVRRISASVSRSYTWLSAAAPPATSAVPATAAAMSDRFSGPVTRPGNSQRRWSRRRAH